MSEPRAPRIATQLNFGNKAARALWLVVQALLYRPSPRLLHGWRRGLLRCFGAKIAAGAHPYPRARIWAPWNLVMAERSCLADDVDCYNVALIDLGADVVVSQYAYLCSASHDADDPDFVLITAPISIGRKAWIGADAFIGPGVAIGAGAVVGARSTVFANVGEGEIVGGSPARLLRQRNPAGWN